MSEESKNRVCCENGKAEKRGMASRVGKGNFADFANFSIFIIFGKFYSKTYLTKTVVF